MLVRLTAIVVTAASVIACGGSQLLSPPATWGEEFTNRSPSTDSCVGGTLGHLRSRMTVSEPHALSDYRGQIPDSIRAQILDDDQIHEFQFSTDPDSAVFWGFSGYLVSRGECVVHAEVTGYDN